MRKYKTISVILIAATIVTSCNSNRQNEEQPNTKTELRTTNSEEQTKAAFNGHIGGFMKGDIKEMLSNWTEESIIIIGDKTYSGLEEIEGYLQGQISEFGQQSVDFKMGVTKFHENIAYITWSATTPLNSYKYATETYLVENGKIMVQTVGWIKEPK